MTLSNLINSNVILTRWYTPTHGAIGRGRERDIERERGEGREEKGEWRMQSERGREKGRCIVVGQDWNCCTNCKQCRYKS